MIDKAILFLVDELNGYFKNTLHITENKVILSSLENNAGSIISETENKIVATIINIEEDYVLKNLESAKLKLPLKNSPIFLNVSVLFSNNFSSQNYVEALHFIPMIIVFFKQKHIFKYADIPFLSCTLENTSIQDLAHVWSMLGTTYKPSLLYKMRIEI